MPVTACVRTTVSSSPSTSATPATVTVCATFQFVASKASVVWSPGVPLSVSAVTFAVAPPTVTVTAAVGAMFRRTVYVAVPPSTTERDVGDTFRPATSSSTAVTLMLEMDTPS